MNNVLLLIILIFSFLSCKKSELATLENQIAGTWQLDRTVSFDPPPTQTQPNNNKIVIVIKRDGLFERRKNDSTVFRGNYIVKKAKDVCPQQPNQIYFTSTEYPHSYSRIELVNGELIMGTPTCYMDGGFSYYKRLK